MALSTEVQKAYSFEHDPAIFDKTMVSFLERFYAFSDIKEKAEDWVECFAEDGILQKGTVIAKGHQGKCALSFHYEIQTLIKYAELRALNLGSWHGQSSRKHSILKSYSSKSQHTDEIMLLGLSEYSKTDSSHGRMKWAAKLSLMRQSDGEILIESYHIFPVSLHPIPCLA